MVRVGPDELDQLDGEDNAPSKAEEPPTWRGRAAAASAWVRRTVRLAGDSTIIPQTLSGRHRFSVFPDVGEPLENRRDRAAHCNHRDCDRSACMHREGLPGPGVQRVPGETRHACMHATNCHPHCLEGTVVAPLALRGCPPVPRGSWSTSMTSLWMP